MNDIRRVLLDRVGLISTPLDEAMASAMAQSERRAAGFDHARFPHTRPLTIRQDVRLALEELAPLPDGWEIGGDPRKMGQLTLEDSVTGMRCRFLKAPYSQPDRIPHAGYNPARRQAWSQPALAQVPIPSLTEGLLRPEMGMLAGVEFLTLWAYNDPSARTDGYALRLVHPLGPGSFGKRTPCDIDLVIPHGRALGEDDLRFAGAEEDEVLFFFDLEAENDDKGMA